MSNGLIDLSGLTKPATVLIERVSDALGGMARPWQILRVAKAEGKAEIARAEAKVQVSEIERRAIARLVAEEGRKQENIESITSGALPHLKEDAKPEEVESDWLSHFFDRSRFPSDVPLGHALLTRAGQEMADLFKDQVSSNFIDKTLHYWMSEDYRVGSIISPMG